MAWGDDDDDDEALPARTETGRQRQGLQDRRRMVAERGGAEGEDDQEIFVKKVETRESRRPSLAESKAYAPTASASPARKKTIAT